MTRENLRRMSESAWHCLPRLQVLLCLAAAAVLLIGCSGGNHQGARQLTKTVAGVGCGRHCVDTGSWSPDGQRIAFVRESCSVTPDVCGVRNSQLYVSNADGSDLHRLTHTNTPEDYGVPVWSPDGKRIAFSRVRLIYGGYYGGPSEIYATNADGSKLLRLTQNPAVRTGFNIDPSWSPNGKQIAFDSSAGPSDFSQIYVVNADGSKLHRLTNDSGDDSAPVWSPDGGTIVFSSSRDQPTNSSRQIYVMSATGSDFKALTRNWDVDHVSAAWSADGRKIAFSISAGLIATQTYVMNADGSNPHSVRLLCRPAPRGWCRRSPSWPGLSMTRGSRYLSP